ncbi:MAG: hypothetical protein V4720_02250, partial [Pseudomonadota bacterium]
MPTTPANRRPAPRPRALRSTGWCLALALGSLPATADTAAVVQDHILPGFTSFAEAAQSLADI